MSRRAELQRRAASRLAGAAGRLRIERVEALLRLRELPVGAAVDLPLGPMGLDLDRLEQLQRQHQVPDAAFRVDAACPVSGPGYALAGLTVRVLARREREPVCAFAHALVEEAQRTVNLGAGVFAAAVGYLPGRALAPGEDDRVCAAAAAYVGARVLSLLAAPTREPLDVRLPEEFDERTAAGRAALGAAGAAVREVAGPAAPVLQVAPGEGWILGGFLAGRDEAVRAALAQRLLEVKRSTQALIEEAAKSSPPVPEEDFTPDRRFLARLGLRVGRTLASLPPGQSAAGACATLAEVHGVPGGPHPALGAWCVFAGERAGLARESLRLALARAYALGDDPLLARTALGALRFGAHRRARRG